MALVNHLVQLVTDIHTKDYQTTVLFNLHPFVAAARPKFLVIVVAQLISLTASEVARIRDR